jgi:hypothetical protein
VCGRTSTGAYPRRRPRPPLRPPSRRRGLLVVRCHLRLPNGVRLPRGRLLRVERVSERLGLRRRYAVSARDQHRLRRERREQLLDDELVRSSLAGRLQRQLGLRRGVHVWGARVNVRREWLHLRPDDRDALHEGHGLPVMLVLHGRGAWLRRPRWTCVPRRGHHLPSPVLRADRRLRRQRTDARFDDADSRRHLRGHDPPRDCSPANYQLDRWQQYKCEQYKFWPHSYRWVQCSSSGRRVTLAVGGRARHRSLLRPSPTSCVSRMCDPAVLDGGRRAMQWSNTMVLNDMIVSCPPH